MILAPVSVRFGGSVVQGTYFDATDAGFPYPSYLNGVNSAGEVFGYYFSFDGHQIGFTYVNGQINTINYPHSWGSTINAVDANGRVFGIYYENLNNTQGLPQTYLIDDSEQHTFTFGRYAGSGYFGGSISGVNNSGILFGQYKDLDYSWHAYAYNFDTQAYKEFYPAISAITSQIYSINNNQIYGSYLDRDQKHYHGFYGSYDQAPLSFDVPGYGVTDTYLVGADLSGKMYGFYFQGFTKGLPASAGFIRNINGSITTISVPGEDKTTIEGVDGSGDFFGHCYEIIPDYTGKAQPNIIAHSYVYFRGQYSIISIPTLPAETDYKISNISPDGTIAGTLTIPGIGERGLLSKINVAASDWHFALANSNFNLTSKIETNTVIGKIDGLGGTNSSAYKYSFAQDSLDTGDTQNLYNLYIDNANGQIKATSDLSSDISTWVIVKDGKGIPLAKQLIIKFGTSGNDDISVSAGTNLVFGLGSDDTINAIADCSIATGSGNDTINGFLSGDTVDGGDGLQDTLSLTATSDYLNKATDQQLLNVECISASKALTAVTIDLHVQSESLNIKGSSKNDFLYGGDGNDIIDGGGGQDIVRGGSGKDHFNVMIGSTTAIIDLGNGGADVLQVSQGGIANATVTEDWTATNDTRNDGVANILCSGFKIDLSKVSAGKNGYTLTNDGFGTKITGSALDDKIIGKDDPGYGSGGMSVLLSDTLNGFEGKDILTGGSGADTFVVGDADTATITDLGYGGVDIIQVDKGGVANATIVSDWISTDASKNSGEVNLETNGFLVDLSAIMNGDNGYKITNIGRGTFLTGSKLDDIIIGGKGDDTIDGWKGGDEITGGGGADTFVVGDDNKATIKDLGDISGSISGTDSLLVYKGGSVSATVVKNWIADVSTHNDGLVEIVTNGFDVDLSAVTKGSKGFSITNEGWKGTIITGAATLIVGSALDDELAGGDQLDYLFGGIGDDTLDGGKSFPNADDVLNGGLGADTFKVSDEDTAIINDLGYGGSDVLRVNSAGVANATVIQSWIATDETQNNGTANLVTNGLSIDLSAVTKGSNGFVVTNTGSATKFVGSGLDDVLNGGQMADTLQGGPGTDILKGNGGVDTFLVDSGTDTVSDLGNSGSDILKVSTSATVNAVAADNWIATVETINNGVATISSAGFNINLSGVRLGNGFTVINTGHGATFVGSLAEDILKGGSGADMLTGGAGNDTIDGGAGVNTASYVGKLADYNIKYLGNGTYTIEDSISGRDGKDTITNIQYVKFSDSTKAIKDLVVASNAKDIFSSTSDPIPISASNSTVSVIATGIDQSGNAFGYYLDKSNYTHGCIVLNGLFQSLNVPGSTSTKVVGLPSTDLVWGYYNDNAGAAHGFVQYNTQFYQLDNIAGTYGTWLTTGNSNQAAGAYCDAMGQLHGYIETFTATGPQFVTLNDPLGVKGTWVTNLSSDGKATGFYIDASNTYHGFVYQGGSFTDVNMVSSIHTIPIGINSSGQVVGEYMDAKGWHGFLYSNGIFSPYDYANANLTAFTGINDSGNIVGIATVGTSTQSFATHIVG